MFLPPEDDAPSPWHDGERRLQRAAGVVEQMDKVGRRAIRDHLTEQHRAFYPQLPFVVMGAVDTGGDAWATLRAGRPGFLSSPDPHHLALVLPREPADPADDGFENGAAVALLGIEPSTRRRNRLNGVVKRSGPQGFAIAVEQAFGNCPKYIEPRDYAFTRDVDAPPDAPRVELPRLEPSARALIERADTFFVASYIERPGGRRQVDVSHRGGRPGFVRIDSGLPEGGVVEGASLTIPDFAGNRFFNTLGNVVINPKTGLAFVDFESGGLLQMTGDAELLPAGPDLAAFEGAERLWRFRPRRIVWRPAALPLRWRLRGGHQAATLQPPMR